jgi:hypothetical protein
MKQPHSPFFALISVILLLFTLEIIGRFSLFIMGFPFWQPGQTFIKKFYPELQPVADTSITAHDSYYDLLILGGSAISTEYSQMEVRLQKILNADSTKKKARARVFNLARASHTSLDNLLKYRHLSDKHFDVVIYYEAINENRANLVSDTDFRPDYQHILWYYDLDLVSRHPEMNVTVLPYLLHKSVGLLLKKLRGEPVLNREAMYASQNHFGENIKTVAPFATNVSAIAALAKQRGAQFLPVTYALYFPQSIAEKGANSDYSEFSGCSYPSPLGLWGNPSNVRKGVQQHNLALKEIARLNRLPICHMDSIMPRQKQYYCDLCHFSPEGAATFARLVSACIPSK